MTGYLWGDRALLLLGIWASASMAVVLGLAVWAFVVSRRARG